jgi:nickel-dependent lactate racemase
MQLSNDNDKICELAEAAIVTVRGSSASIIAEHNIVHEVQQAFAHPLDYPKLADATVPGDTIVVAIDQATPQVLPVVAGTLAALKHAGVEQSAITLLLSPELASDQATHTQLRELAGAEITLVVHAADDKEQMSLLGVSGAGLPLRLNRVLCDADLVIPIGPSRGSKHDCNPAGMLFPRFSDQETLGRFHSPGSHETSAARKKLEGEIRECDWILGVGLALQVIPGPHGTIAALCCGTPAGIAPTVQRHYREVWATDVRQQADLIVATIVGNEAQQTWQNLSRALASADELLEPGGAIAICSEIATRPGPSGKRLRDAQDLADVERKLRQDAFADSAATLRICRQLQRGTIYLQSQLGSAVVESLGFAPMESDQELQRLVGSYRRCLVLEEAQHLEPKLVGA